MTQNIISHSGEANSFTRDNQHPSLILVLQKHAPGSLQDFGRFTTSGYRLYSEFAKCSFFKILNGCYNSSSTFSASTRIAYCSLPVSSEPACACPCDCPAPTPNSQNLPDPHLIISPQRAVCSHRIALFPASNLGRQRPGSSKSPEMFPYPESVETDSLPSLDAEVALFCPVSQGTVHRGSKL